MLWGILTGSYQIKTFDLSELKYGIALAPKGLTGRVTLTSSSLAALFRRMYNCITYKYALASYPHNLNYT